jgi:hypothetical protein
MTWHKLMAKALANQRAIITALSAVLGLLVAFGVLRPASEQAILAVAGIIFAWLGGSAYVEGKHVEALARTTGSGTAMDPPKAS